MEEYDEDSRVRIFDIGMVYAEAASTYDRALAMLGRYSSRPLRGVVSLVIFEDSDNDRLAFEIVSGGIPQEISSVLLYLLEEQHRDMERMNDEGS